MPLKSGVFLGAGVVVALLVMGCAKGNDQSTTTTTTTSGASTAPVSTSTTTASSSMSGSVAQGDPARGKTIFTGNCAACHGATGTEGGVGPSLKNEKSRKSYEQTIAWIHNPSPPMPKLWPSPLNDKDVADVAAYVQSL